MATIVPHRFFCLVVFVLLTGLSPLYAQRFQLQLGIGANFSEAFLHDDGLSRERTSIFYDSIGNIQLSLGVNARLFGQFHLRAEGNYKNFRTFYDFEMPGTGGSFAVLGNLYKENWTVSLLPEYRFNLVKPDRFELPLYAFAGPVLSVEQAKNYSYSLVIHNGASDVFEAVKPDASLGWSIGAGINPKWRRLGALAEMRYTRTAAAVEGAVIPEVSFGHFTLAAGLTFNL